jgi:hypothetical protein
LSDFSEYLPGTVLHMIGLVKVMKGYLMTSLQTGCCYINITKHTKRCSKYIILNRLLHILWPLDDCFPVYQVVPVTSKLLLVWFFVAITLCVRWYQLHVHTTQYDLVSMYYKWWLKCIPVTYIRYYAFLLTVYLYIQQVIWLVGCFYKVVSSNPVHYNIMW